MHERDLENWRAIDAGLRPATWADFIGHVEGAAYLSPAGVELIPRMVDSLTGWFSDNWLGPAIGSEGGGRIPWLARFSPTLSIGGDRGAAGAFVELVRWWAALESQATKPGIGQVRKDLRNDLTLTRVLHTLTQTRLGAVATSAGLDVKYEPTPGDLQISDEETRLTIEVFAMRTPRDLDAKLRTSEEMFGHLDRLSRLHVVHFRGQLPPLDTDLSAWQQRVSSIAASAGRLGIALSIQWEGVELFVEPGDATPGTTLDGPEIAGDVGARLRNRVASKARQIANAEAGWLWLENHGAVDMLVPIHSLSLVEQLAAYQALFDGALADVASAMGVTFSGAGARTGPPPPAEKAAQGWARGLRLPLTLDRTRTTFHLPCAEGPVSRLMWRVVEHERDWLDHALTTLGIPCPALNLVRADLRHPA